MYLCFLCSILYQTDLSLVTDNSYHILNRNRTRHGGGIAIYINKSLQLLDFNIDANFELINITVFLNGKVKIAVLACYRSEHLWGKRNNYQDSARGRKRAPARDQFSCGFVWRLLLETAATL